jgi:hypothetical protein
VLVGRSPLPAREEWDARLAANDEAAARIRAVRRLESLGAEVLYAAADVTEAVDLQKAVAAGRARFGRIEGVVHAAGLPGGGIIPLKTVEAACRVMAPKLEGTVALERALSADPPDFLVLCSSIAALVGGVGQIDYVAANAFQDAFAHRAPAGVRTLAVNWDAWREAGMARNVAVAGHLKRIRDLQLEVGIGNEEGALALERGLASGLSQLAVFTMDMMPALGRKRAPRAAPVAEAGPAPSRAEAASQASTPEPAVAAAGLGSDLERTIAASWERILGRPAIAASDNFFELGGDSLTALQVIALLKAQLGRDVPIVTFYAAPTVALLAQALGEPAQAEAPVLADVGRRAETRLDLMQRRRRPRGESILDGSSA